MLAFCEYGVFFAKGEIIMSGFTSRVLSSRRVRLLGLGLVAAAWTAPGLAGDTPLYAPAPGWAKVVPSEEIETDTAAAELLVDNQYWLEDGRVQHYFDRVIRIDSPDALTGEGTLKASWLPDKGDLTVHRLEILRDGAAIDLLAQGSEFEVIRREQGLESRLLDGQLTATLAVPGLRVGDLLRLAYTVDTDDQALGDEMQASHYIASEPYQVGRARILASWPKSEEIFWQAFRAEDAVEISEAGGITTLSIDLPIARLKEMPSDAPYRYNYPPILSVGTFSDWQELSRVMYPHFEEAAQIEEGSELSGKVAAIMAKTGDPLERAVLATRLVQDEISYLMNGLDGGNYLPQSAEETWANLYGDCKAKSVLLHAMLQEMGIDSQVVLVTTGGGDALSELMPLPGHFDHMITRATIDGVDYWIDGTSSGTRATNIGEVPAFYHALPLTKAGADLAPMTQRAQPWPDSVISLDLDYSAGFDLPGLMTMRMDFYGAGGAQLRQMVARMDDDTRRQMLRQIGGGNSFGTVTDFDITYDDEAAKGSFVLTGVADSEFSWEDGELSMDLLSGMVPNFTPDRTRTAWRSIPVATDGPTRSRMVTAITLPDRGTGFALEGNTALQAEVANNILHRFARIDNGRLDFGMEVTGQLGEIPASRIGEVRREVVALQSEELKLVGPTDPKWRFERDPAELARSVAPLRAVYDEAVAEADPDDFGPLRQRISFNETALAFDRAIADLDTLIEEEGSVSDIRRRSQFKYRTGDWEGALADGRAAYDLDPSYANGMFLSSLLADLERLEESEAVLDELYPDEEERSRDLAQRATLLALGGMAEDGLDLLVSDNAQGQPTADMLNSECWYRGTRDVGLDAAGVEVCTAAVEQASWPAGALDSRAMLHYKMGNAEQALADLDAALKLSPDMAAGLYLRGIVRLSQGDTGGRDDIRAAERLYPSIARTYVPYGIERPRM